MKTMVAAEKIERHLDFLSRRNKKPLFGTILGWENLSRYTDDPTSFFPLGETQIEEITCERFLPMYRRYAATLPNDDDLLRTLEPLPFFPWAEAAIGCGVTYTGKNFWSSPLNGSDEIEELIEKLRGELQRIKLTTVNDGTSMSSIHVWQTKYGDFIDFLTLHFGDRYPIGQTILRGPLDMAAAAFGDENLLYQCYDHPSLVHEFITLATDIFMTFVRVQFDRLPTYAGGYVIGTYYLWTPGCNLRLQEDAMALLSPELYREFVYAHDCAIAATADWALFHMHATGLHHLDSLLQNQSIKIIQVSKDEGIDLSVILPHLIKIQEAEKCLLVKGRMSHNDLQDIHRRLRPEGLCLQVVS